MLTDDQGGSGTDDGTCVTLLVVGARIVVVVTGVNGGATEVETGAVTDVEVGGTINVGA